MGDPKKQIFLETIQAIIDENDATTVSSKAILHISSEVYKWILSFFSKTRQFLNHRHQKKFTVQLINETLEFLNQKPLFGYNRAVSYSLISQENDLDLLCRNDEIIDLSIPIKTFVQDYPFDCLPSFHWCTVKGEIPQSQDSTSEKSMVAIESPKPFLFNDQNVVLLNTRLDLPILPYNFTNIINDIEKGNKVEVTPALLPLLLRLITDKVSTFVQTESKAGSARDKIRFVTIKSVPLNIYLQFTRSLYENPDLDKESHLNQYISVVLTILLGDFSYYQIDTAKTEPLKLRRDASEFLGLIVQEHSETLKGEIADLLLLNFRSQFSYCSLIGSALGLLSLGTSICREAVLPYLPTIFYQMERLPFPKIEVFNEHYQLYGIFIEMIRKCYYEDIIKLENDKVPKMKPELAEIYNNLLLYVGSGFS